MPSKIAERKRAKRSIDNYMFASGAAGFFLLLIATFGVVTSADVLDDSPMTLYVFLAAMVLGILTILFGSVVLHKKNKIGLIGIIGGIIVLAFPIVLLLIFLANFHIEG
jgi:hypothetical protein